MPPRTVVFIVVALAIPASSCSGSKDAEPVRTRQDLGSETTSRVEVTEPARARGRVAAAPNPPTAIVEKPPKKTERPWYDPTPLLVSLRPNVRAGMPKAAGVRDLKDLPLYDLHITLDARRRAYILKQKTWYTNSGKAPMDEIVFRLYANTVGTEKRSSNEIPVRFLEGRCENDMQCTVTADGASVIRAKLASPLPVGGRVRIAMELTGRLQYIDSSRTNILTQGLEGMATMTTHGGGGDYGLLATGDGIVSLANFYPILARRHQAKWVERDLSTLGDLGSDQMSHVLATIITDQSMRVISTGVMLGEAQRLSGGRIESRIGAALVRDFTILTSPDFTCSKKNVNGIVVRSCFLRRDRDAGRRVLDAAAHSLALFEKRFGEYPYVDLDVVEAPLVGGAGGVEFAGLVTVASMLYRPMNFGGSPIASLLGGNAEKMRTMQPMFDSMLEFVTAHEVAHQYWHGLVGSDSRLNPFGDEGLAQFSALLYMEDRYGNARADKEAEMQVAMGYRMMRTMGHPDGPADLPVHRFPTPISYGGLVYGKGPIVYRELRKLFGDGSFFATLREYVRTYAFRLAPRRAFIEMLAYQKSEANSLARRWLDEAHGDEDLGTASMSQMLQMLGLQDPTGQLGALDLGELMKPPDPNDPTMKELLGELEKLSNPSSDDGAGMKEMQEILKFLPGEK